MAGLKGDTFHRIGMTNRISGNQTYQFEDNDLPNSAMLANAVNSLRFNNQNYKMRRNIYSTFSGDLIPLGYGGGLLKFAISPLDFKNSLYSLIPTNNKTKELYEIPEEYEWFFVDSIDMYIDDDSVAQHASDAQLKGRNRYAISPSALGITETKGDRKPLRGITFYRGDTLAYTFSYREKGRNLKGDALLYNSKRENSDWLKRTNSYPETAFVKKSINKYPTYVPAIIDYGRKLFTPSTPNIAGPIDSAKPVRYSSGGTSPALGNTLYDGNNKFIMQLSNQNVIQHYDPNGVNSILPNTSFTHSPNHGTVNRFQSMVESNAHIDHLSFDATGKLSLYKYSIPEFNITTPYNVGTEFMTRNGEFVQTRQGSKAIKGMMNLIFDYHQTLFGLFTTPLNVQNHLRLIKMSVDTIDIITEFFLQMMILRQKYASHSNETTFADGGTPPPFFGGAGQYESYLSDEYETITVIIPQIQTLRTKDSSFKNKNPFHRLQVNKLFKSVNEFEQWFVEQFGKRLDNTYYTLNVRPWFKSDYDEVWDLWGKGINYSLYLDKRYGKFRDNDDTSLNYTRNKFKI